MIDYLDSKGIKIQLWYTEDPEVLPPNYVALYTEHNKTITFGPNAYNLHTVAEEIFHGYDYAVCPGDIPKGNREVLAKLFLYQMELEQNGAFNSGLKLLAKNDLNKYLKEPKNSYAVNWLNSALNVLGYTTDKFPRDLQKLDPTAFNNLFSTKINNKD